MHALYMCAQAIYFTSEANSGEKDHTNACTQVGFTSRCICRFPRAFDVFVIDVFVIYVFVFDVFVIYVFVIAFDVFVIDVL